MVKRSALLLLLLSLVCTAFTQDFDSLLLIQRRGDPQEKIHVHFDKSYYNPGETIWFKAYLFSGLEPSLVSRNFYAELTDEQGLVISQKTAPLVFAGANSHFDIDSAFSKPAVYFRAYTVNMLNGDTGFLYTKQIRILTAKATPARQALPPSQTTLSLLPEGGDLVEGIACTVAFKATNERGLPVTVSGSVTDNTGAKVADLNTLFNGMGSFTLLPQAGKTYTATWKAEGGKQNSTALPAAKREGVVLKIAGADNGKRFIIHRTPEAGDALKQLHVIAFMNQQLMFKADIDLRAKTTASGTFPTGEIPSGILQVTVFDKNYKPLSERVSFVNNRDYEFDGDVFVAQKDFARRG
ncbi:MAG TPA: hypothetical protein VEX65_06850, partial [Flavisolibacter sp.]|nr:hypothetical protein [Flavisolibacter sp.]